jgi:vancomycin permeability regulator SanA
MVDGRLTRRAAAGLLGLFSLANVVVGTLLHGFDMNHWWLDVRPLPGWVAAGLSLAAGVLLAWWAVSPARQGFRRRLTSAVVLTLVAASAWDVIVFYALLALGTVESAFPIPLSLFVCGLLLWLHQGLSGSSTPTDDRRPARSHMDLAAGLAVLLLLPVAFPVAQMVCFGKTDYRRSADAAVIFGAAVWPGNIPSQALEDRVRTGIELYRNGTVNALVMSGGPSEQGLQHETEVMRRLALEAGLPGSAIWLDPAGEDTQATVRNTVAMLRARGLRRVLVVSHFYHLPRIHMAYQRAGMTVYTVPARAERVLLKLPYYMAREAVALWFYYLRPLWED